MKTLSVIVLALFLTACSKEKGTALDGTGLPTGATKVIAQGGGWKTFSYNGVCYLNYRSGYAMSTVMTPCEASK